MTFKSSIKNKLTNIIIIVSTISSFIGYGSFVYWYMQNQHEKTIEQSKTVAIILSQDIAKLTFLNEVSAAADITSNLKSFKNINRLVIYNLNKKAVYQYSKDNKSFPIKNIKVLSDPIIENNILKTYLKAKYQNNNLGYVYIEFHIDSMSNVIKENIFILFFILLSMFIISFILASIYAKKFTYPILNLVTYLAQIDTLKNIPSLDINVNNEYGKLYDEINTMLKRIDESNEQLKIASFAFQTQNGMIITNKYQEILQVNDSFTKITGYTKEDVIGKKPSVLSSKLQSDEFYKKMYESLNKKDFWHGEILNKNKKGEVITESLTIHVIRDEYYQVLYYVASFSDITQEKLTQKKLAEKENILIQQSKMAAMGEMLANIAHQWRQPLSVISTISTSLLHQKEMDIEINKEYEIKSLNKINKNTQYLSDTINDFKNFFNPNKNKNDFFIKEVCAKALLLSNADFKKLNIKVIENIQNAKIYGLENELIQVIMNILSNAKDALVDSNPKEKLVFINSIVDDNNQIIITIYDNAGGIEENIIDKIFEPYFTTKHKAQGTGIGLYMSNEIISKHMDGSITVSNKEFDFYNTHYKGALFEIIIPIK